MANSDTRPSVVSPYRTRNMIHYLMRCYWVMWILYSLFDMGPIIDILPRDVDAQMNYVAAAALVLDFILILRR